MGISFCYDSGWIEEMDETVRYRSGFDIYFYNKKSSLGISKLPIYMNAFVSKWMPNKAIICAINQDETIVEDVKFNKYNIDGEDTTSVITRVSKNEENTLLEYILVGHKDQYYLLVFRTKCSNQCSSDVNSKNIINVTNNFKFLE